MDRYVVKAALRSEIIEMLPVNPQEAKTKKIGELRDLLWERLVSDDAFKKAYYERYREKIALSPYGLEMLLGCTKSERKRWESEGKLAVTGYAAFKFGDAPLYDRWQAEHLTEEKICSWRKEHEEKSEQHRREGAAKAVITRKQNEHKLAEERDVYREEVRCWYEKDAQAGPVLEFACTIMWLSRLAKRCHLKARRARTSEKKAVYAADEKLFYRKKTEGLLLLYEILKNTAVLTLSFYKPENPDKRKVTLCKHHADLFEKLREQGREFEERFSFYDFMNSYEDEIRCCSECVILEIENYYSLYCLKIESETVPGISFTFHLPYPQGKERLPEISGLPAVWQYENTEGLFRFGRAADDEEAVLHSRKEVFADFDRLEKYLRSKYDIVQGVLQD